MGNVIQGGVGQAPARQALLKAGIPATVSAVTINKVCGSGLKAVMLAAQAIKAGDAEVVVAGGQESMSNAPYYVYGMRNGVKLGDQTLVDGMIKDGLWCVVVRRAHGRARRVHGAEGGGDARASRTSSRPRRTARPSRRSAGGKFAAEIAPVKVPGRKGDTIVDADEGPRDDTTADTLAKLRPAFPARAERRADGDRGQRVARSTTVPPPRRDVARRTPTRTASQMLGAHHAATRRARSTRRSCSSRRSPPCGTS